MTSPVKPSFKLIAGGLCSIEPIYDEQDHIYSFPRSFNSEEDRFEVREILDHWPGTDCDYYKILTVANCTLIIKRDRNTESWDIIRWFD